MPPGSLVGVLKRVEKRRGRAASGRKASSSALLEAALRAVQACTGTHVPVTDHTTPAMLTARVSMAILKSELQSENTQDESAAHCEIMMSRALCNVSGRPV